MDNALYVGLSRQMTLRRELDVVANNIANADTAGFKVESLMVGTEPAQPARTPTAAARPIKFVARRRRGARLQPGRAEADRRAVRPGHRGRGLLPGHRPRTATRYTRDGRFTHRRRRASWSTQAGHPVLDAGGGEITTRPDKGPALDRRRTAPSARAASWSARSASSASPPRRPDEGRRQPLPQRLQPAARAPRTDARIRQGMVEGSNVKPVARDHPADRGQPRLRERSPG